ncbi:MAG: class I SAM-dependent methyltransferase [Sphingomonas bacterium]
MAGFYDRYILPKFIGCACGTKPIMKQRGKIVPKAAGEVLELGMGAGHNLAFYDPAAVTSVTAIEPSAELRAAAMAAPRPESMRLEPIDGVAEALPFDAERFDCILCTYTLCTVGDVAATLHEARRVLKPGGRFLFCEHGLAPDAKVARWQRRIDPVWKRMAGGCHLSRPVAATIAAHGFAIDMVETMYLPGTPRIAGWNEWGVARPV